MLSFVASSLSKRRFLSTVSSSSLNLEALSKWIVLDKRLTLSDTLHPEHVSDLYITLPTRDGTRKPYTAPAIGSPLSYGHHLAFFHPRNRENMLRWDGTDADFCPPEPFTRRMWAGGKILWRAPLHVGEKVIAFSDMLDVQKKGFEKGIPMVFVKQKIEYKLDGSNDVAIEEERSHVYLAAPANSRGVKQGALSQKGTQAMVFHRSKVMSEADVAHSGYHSDGYACSRVFVSLSSECHDPVPVLCFNI